MSRSIQPVTNAQLASLRALLAEAYSQQDMNRAFLLSEEADQFQLDWWRNAARAMAS